MVLFIVFGSLLATLLPLLTAGLSLGVGIGVVGLLSNVFSMASFSSELALLIGLGVGVDYALFIVTRYKQGILRGLSAEQAVAESLDTSGRAVLFAGLIVCIAMLGMFALGVSFLYGVAVAAAIAVAFTVLSALTLLPALLGFFGRLVLRRRERRALQRGRACAPPTSRPRWARWTGWMQKRPAVFAAGATALLLILAIPFLSMRLGSADAGSDPANTTTRKAYDLLAKGFGPGYNGPLQLVAEVDSAQQKAAFLRVQQAVAKTPGIVGAADPHFIPGANGRPDVAIADLYPKGSPQDQSTADLLHKVRNDVVPAAEKGTGLTVLTGGQTAIFDDFSHVLAGKLPLFIGVVVLLSFLLLMIVFRSIAIPLTAAIMNMLSAGAAFGLVTAIFQNGWGASLIGVDKTGPIEAFLPVLMFPILFGLSMDYEVFLVSRIYEEWHRRRDNTRGGQPRPRGDRAHDHRRRGDHGPRVRRVRPRRRARHQAVRHRPRRRRADRRHARALGARAGRDADARRPQLEASGVPRPHPAAASTSRAASSASRRATGLGVSRSRNPSADSLGG